MSQTSRKSREKKSGKWLVRQQPERKEKHRNGQRRANRKQHYKLSKPSARHDMRNANAQHTVRWSVADQSAPWASIISFSVPCTREAQGRDFLPAKSLAAAQGVQKMMGYP
jgi:hypothetical protein